MDNVKYGTERAREAQVLGTTAAYEEVHDSYVERGRFLSATDVDRAAHVVVLGVDIADALQKQDRRFNFMMADVKPISSRAKRRSGVQARDRPCQGGPLAGACRYSK